ncbi:hypothetical protein ACFLUT_04255, partial [Chloroflexota bacterium]
RGMTLRSKVATLGLLWLGVSLAAAFATDSSALRTALPTVAVGVTIHIVTLKTASSNDSSMDH